MTINNQSRAGWIKLFYYLSIFIYLSSIIVLLYLNLENTFKLIETISVFFILLIIFSLYLNLNFIIYKEGDHKIILRYYPLHPFHDNFKAIEIQKESLAKYHIKKKLFGLKPELTLYQNTKKGMAKYPKVCLSALSISERKALEQSLSKNSVKK